MKTTLLYVTYNRDFEFLKYSLRSVEKFSTGFNSVVIVVPDYDHDSLLGLLDVWKLKTGFPVVVLSGSEWPNAGFVWHEYQILCADKWCADADFVVHTDPDVIFEAPVSPATFIRDGKPVLQFERFESIGRRHPGVMEWKSVTERCLPFPILFETMRQHGFTAPRRLYPLTRELIEQKTGKPCADYVRGCKNEFPNGFCEFVTLGNVAMNRLIGEFHLVDNGLKSNPDQQDFPMIQFWSRRKPNEEQDFWMHGKQVRLVPMEIIRSLGLE